MRRPHLALIFSVATALTAVPVLTGVAGGVTAGPHASVAPTYRADDYADGQAMSVLPPGENGLTTAPQIVAAEAGGARPQNSQSQLAQYANLLYGYPSLTNSTLPTYYNDESFGVKPADVVRTETPASGVTIYRDKLDIPHIYGDSDATMSFGAGYAQAEDRLFFMDVLRHYGEGTLASFVGPNCADEQMDHDELLLAAYTPAQAQAQIDALPAEYGAQGVAAKQAIDNYVKGVNAYIAYAIAHPTTALPGDYTVTVGLPTKWTEGDVVAIAGLIGGIFGKGGGDETGNVAALNYLQKQYGAAAGAQAFSDLKQDDDPLAATTVVDKSFPYEHHGKVDPATTALPDSTKLIGGPTATTPGCEAVPVNLASSATTKAMTALPQHLSNAVVVAGKDTASGHPVAVFGPQVSYFAPEILMQEDLHSPDYAAEGASFPGTGLVELGRGEDFAWSATSAGSDLIDQRVEKVCDPHGGTPTATEPYYLFDGQCIAMTHETFSEGLAVTKPGGPGLPTTIDHQIYLTRHGIVQGWTTVGGAPVAIVVQRSTYNHDIDSVVGFLRWGQPALTHDAASWMAGAAQIEYTFNWFYADDRDVAYYTSGLDPIRPSDVDPDLPAWGTGNAEWQGYLGAAQHVHEINPKVGYFVSWNNKPAPGFSAADDERSFGPVYRSVLLTNDLKASLAAHHDRLTRAQVVQVMETAASQDLDGVTVLPQLLDYLGSRAEPTGVAAMVNELKAWYAAGAHRQKAKPGDAQYAHAAAVATMDELVPNLIEALFDPILSTGQLVKHPTPGSGQDVGYASFPLYFVNNPNSDGGHLGSAYDGGFESYLVRILEQLRGQKPKDAFGATITSHLCGGGPTSCPAAVDAALATTYAALVAANGGSTTVSSWTSSTVTAAAKVTMPAYDAIAFRALGVVGQPRIDWQNRPTFQQVVEFPRHRPRAVTAPVKHPGGKPVTPVRGPSGALAATGLAGGLGVVALAATAGGLVVSARRRRRAG